MIEDDLREALDARASAYETDPRAWIGVQRRVSRRRRLAWAKAATVPLAAGAVLGGAAIVVTGAGQGDDTATITASPTVSATAPRKRHDDAYSSVTATAPPIGGTLTVDDPGVGRPMRLWFAEERREDGTTYIALCTARQTPTGGSDAGCGARDDETGHPGERAWFGSHTGHGWPLPEKRTAYGAAREDVTKAEAVTADGTRFPGEIHRLPGAPLSVWTVTYPYEEKIKGWEFSDARGKVVQWVANPFYPGFPDPVGASDAKPVGPALDLPGGPAARMYDDGSLVWRLGGRIMGADSAGKMGISPSDGRLSDGVMDSPVVSHFEASRWFGYARARTARVEVTFGDGRSARARTVRDPWKQGVVMFSVPFEPAGDVYLSGYRVVGFDARGKEVWRHDEPAHPPLWQEDPASAQPDAPPTPSPR
ncbi:hypothetical protein DQ384_19990 [Sphaerisporangium album]|uniref:Uncharacterized protein n=1 Tax=Sphaerisporangium album TaxID=509200 RepID=A0A367FI12_9ACTN|nr:hypothetical protein [Sphaerisporangium album]RCG29347.1 hypothetical protein DQ384_19990 [Sphaerisporangium album]